MSETLPLRQFLVGVDGEGLSDPAVLAAAALAQQVGAELELVHALDVPPALWPRVSRAELERIHAGAIERARALLVAHLENLEREHALVAGSLVRHLTVVPGRPAPVLLERLEASGSDVLFVGPHAERGPFDFGSTARAVLNHAPGGIWQQNGPWRPLEAILAPIDLSDHSDIVLGTARDIARHTGAEVIVLHSFHMPIAAPPLAQADAIGWSVPGIEELRVEAGKELEQRVEALDWGGVRRRTVLAPDPPRAAIRDLEDRVQLVVLGTSGRGALSRLLLGSVAYAVLREARTPVLAIRRPEGPG